jgi:diguanylate cyclase (GGDEF)-like protein/PAS domain S-box-containing protein
MPARAVSESGRTRRLDDYLRAPITWAVVMGVVFVVSAPIPAWNFFGSPEEYVALHTVLEFAAMAVSAMVFALSWNLRRQEGNSEIIVLGSFSLAILLIDLAHTLSYAGMPDLVTPSGPDKAISFWLPGRLLAAIALLIVALLPVWRWPRTAWLAGNLGAVAVAVGVWWVGLFQRDLLPAFFIPGEGLTTVKVFTEYVISALYGLAAVLLFLRARRTRRDSYAWLACAAWVLMLGELFFTLYVSVTDVFNLLGHLFKVVAYLMIYRAIFVAGVQAPYQRLERETSLLRSLIDSVPDLISFTDHDGRYAGANRAFTFRLGVPEESVVGRAPEDLPRSTSPRGDGDSQRFEEVIVDSSGAPALFDTVRTPYFDSSGRPLGVIEVSRDITASRAAEQRIEELAHSDPLTRLPNRQALRRHINDHVAEFDGSDLTAVLVLLQLNDFATVNDTVGHEGGDAILCEAAGRLRQLTAATDLVARVGGDEFAVLLHDETVDSVQDWVAELMVSMTAPFPVGNEEFLTTCAIGIASLPEHAHDFEALYRAADTAMYRASLEGTTAYQVFSSDMHHQSAQRLQLLSGLRHAIESDQLRVHYQPQVSLTDGRIVAAEALIRWQHPDLGLLPPHAFIELAEESGLILPIGEWVIRTAIRDAQMWEAAGAPAITVAVNISAVQFRQPDLAKTVFCILDDMVFPAARLELELTETVAMRNPELAEQTIAQLNALGVQLAIDDFGTGYSSMAYLKRFHIHKVKIDRSFVSDLGQDGEDEAIVQAIINMASALRCSTVAEGVETADQMAFLRDNGCQAMQGFLISKPVPSEDLVAMLKEGAPLTIG